MDQLVAGTPGLIGQISGFLTQKQYKYVAVFVDAVSGYSYVEPMMTSSTAELLNAKTKFEQHCSTYGVRVKHYHVDNATMFTSKDFL